jgi:hypothetical protein
MRTSSNVHRFRSLDLVRHHTYLFAPEHDPEDGRAKPARDRNRPAAGEDLPYKVELWDKDKKTVEQVLAVTANSSIGYAAYYAAAREYPDRYVTLRHKTSIISRSSAPGS